MSRIYISYRQEDTKDIARSLHQHLAQTFGARYVLKDIKPAALTEAFPDVIDSTVATCDLMLVLIGPQWLTADDFAGRRRLDLPGDFVRLELASAFQHGVRVVPLLVNGASLPVSVQLPEPIRPLADQQYLAVTAENFNTKIDRLVDTMKLQPAPDAHKPLPGEETPRRWPWVVIALVIIAALIAASVIFGPRVLRRLGILDSGSSQPVVEVTAEATPDMTSEPMVEPTEEMVVEATAEMTEPTVEVTAESIAEMTAEATMEATAEITVEPTVEPTNTPTVTDEPTDEPTATSTVTDEPEPSETPTEELSETPTVTDEPTDEPTNTPTVTDEPTETPTEMPTDEPTDEPTATSTDTPEPEPTETPTDEPTSAVAAIATVADCQVITSSNARVNARTLPETGSRLIASIQPGIGYPLVQQFIDNRDVWYGILLNGEITWVAGTVAGIDYTELDGTCDDIPDYEPAD